ncbi:hypothetical protein MAPG_08628 [Magnaporthiopsis poae ATCC 64411]|uniref:Uncharacterized protein n=1 Tax=Magnaporthiopsis poae (strain ATCC 64411 / 73-15) TaxID=644358 RepID=A0A0C4E7V3_MAGP6|nr:hypothetical protein MAPG_08628 [Magnaporthiopsis poae ATCC 64411]
MEPAAFCPRRVLFPSRTVRVLSARMPIPCWRTGILADYPGNSFIFLSPCFYPFLYVGDEAATKPWRPNMTASRRSPEIHKNQPRFPDSHKLTACPRPICHADARKANPIPTRRPNGPSSSILQ